MGTVGNPCEVCGAGLEESSPPEPEGVEGEAQARDPSGRFAASEEAEEE